MPFGLCNAGQTFQHLINSIMQGLLYVFVYLDNILVASSSPDQHLTHLCQVFEHLQSHGLIVLPDKCAFRLEEMPFIRLLVSSNGIRPYLPRC